MEAETLGDAKGLVFLGGAGQETGNSSFSNNTANVLDTEHGW